MFLFRIHIAINPCGYYLPGYKRKSAMRYFCVFSYSISSVEIARKSVFPERILRGNPLYTVLMLERIRAATVLLCSLYFRSLGRRWRGVCVCD